MTDPTEEHAVIYTAVKICGSAKAAEIQRECIRRNQLRAGITPDAKIVAREVTRGKWLDVVAIP